MSEEAAIPIAVSVLALLLAAWSAYTTYSLQRSMLDLQRRADARDDERIRKDRKIARQARLVCDLNKPSPKSHTYIVVKNVGDSVATNVRVRVVDRVNNGESPVMDRKDDYGPIAPGGEVSFRAVVMGTGSSPEWETEIIWTDESGETGRVKTMLTPG